MIPFHSVAFCPFCVVSPRLVALDALAHLVSSRLVPATSTWSCLLSSVLPSRLFSSFASRLVSYPLFTSLLVSAPSSGGLSPLSSCTTVAQRCGSQRGGKGSGRRRGVPGTQLYRVSDVELVGSLKRLVVCDDGQHRCR